MKKIDLILAYVKYHPGCKSMDVVRDMKISYCTVFAALRRSVMIITKDHRYTLAAPMSIDRAGYLTHIIETYRIISKSDLRRISGMSYDHLSRQTKRLEMLGVIVQNHHYVIIVPKEPPAEKPRYVPQMNAFDKLLQEAKRK